MGRIKRWLKDPGAGFVFVAIVILVLVVISIIGIGKEQELRGKAEAYRHQLIALCAVIKHADIENADILAVADPLQVSDGSEEIAVLFVIDKEFMERRRYAVYSNGRVIYTGRDSHGTSFNKSEDWGNHPEFSKIGEK